MASVPILGQLGGTMMPSATLNNPAGAIAGGTPIGINQGGNGANVSMLPTGMGGTAGTTTLSPVIGTSAPVSSAGNPYAPVTANTATAPLGSVDGGVSQFASGSLVGSVPTSAQSQDLNSIDPNVFS